MKLKTRAPFLLAGVIILMLLLSFHSLTTYRQRLGDTLREKVQHDMKKANQQSCLLFNTFIEDYFTQLDTVAMFCAAHENLTEAQIVTLIKSCNDGNHYIRLGVAGLDGLFYTGDGVLRDLSGMEYFKRAIAGERLISDVYLSGETGTEVIVLAVPVRKDGQIIATVLARCEVDMFTSLMGDSQFDGYGATMVIQEDGKMVSSYEGMDQYDTFYEALADMEFRGADTLNSFRRRIASGESGFFTYFRNGRERYLYFQPTGLNDYTMISLVLAESMDKRFNDISEQAYTLVVKNVVLYCIILACCWGISVAVREIIRWNQRDPLTQVYNKAGVHAAVEQILHHTGNDARHACLFVDLDNFKAVNDCYGHEAGDKLLQNVTAILTESFRKTDVIGRFGGDEFIVWMNGASLENASKKAEALCGTLQSVGGIPVSASIGIAGYPAHGRNYGEVLHHADQALYVAKKAGKNTYSIYAPETDARKKEDI